MKELEAILKQFETFVKRVLLPSSSFVFFLLVYDVLLNSCKILTHLNDITSIILIIIILVAFMGLSTVLSILNQAIFDNKLKENFDAKIIFTKENKKLKEERQAVVKLLPKLSEGEYTDYIIYQKILYKSKDNTDKYVNQAKEVGITFVSFIIVLIISIVTLYHQDSERWKIISLLLITSFSYFWGLELIKSRYRSRAIRIYSNYIKRSSEKNINKEDS